MENWEYYLPLLSTTMLAPATTEAIAEATRNLFGPVVLGVFFSLVLLGVSTTQAHVYYQTFKKDKLWIKYYIAALFSFDIISSAFDLTFIYISLVKHFGYQQTAERANWLLFCNRGIMGLMGCMVQCYFAWRIFVLTRNRIVPSLVVLLAVSGFAASVVLSVVANRFPHYVDFHKFRASPIVWLTACAASNFIIAISLARYLWTRKSDHFHGDSPVDKIIRLTMQTGLLPAVIAMIDLFLYVFMTKTAAALAFNIILPKLYVNSLMSSLNTRKVWSFGSSSDSHNSNGPTLPQRRGDVISLSTVSRPQVFVTVESHHHREESLYAEKDETTTTSSDVYKGLDDKQQAESESSV